MHSPETNAYKYAAFITLGGLVFGLDIGVISGAIGQVKDLFKLDDIQIGNLGTATNYGAMIALLLAAPLCNLIGRKKTLQIIALFYLISAVASALAPSFLILVMARVLGGLAFCSLALSSMYIGEIAPSDKRGRLVAINQFNIVIGTTAAFFINYWIQQGTDDGASWATALNLEKDAWRWMLGSEIPFALLWLVLVSLVPESPRWLLSVGRESEARKSMKLLVAPENIDVEIETIKANINSENGLSLIGQCAAMFSPLARRALVIGLLFAAVQPATGINAIYTYAPLIFELIGSESPLWHTIWLGVVSLVANVFAFFLVDRLGRRPVVIFGLLWCAVSLGICAWGFNQATYSLDDKAITKIESTVGTDNVEQINKLKSQQGKQFDDDLIYISAMRDLLGDEWVDANRNVLIGKAANINAGLILFGILSFIASFQFSIGPVMWVVLSEIFSNRIRGLAIPIAQLVAAGVSTLVSLFFPWQVSNTGLQSVFLVYCLPVVLGLLVFSVLLPETKNKSIEEIETLLSGNKN